MRFPVKQALEAVLGVSRSTFTSHMARSQFTRLGFVTSNVAKRGNARDEPRQSRPPASGSVVSIEEAGEAFATLVRFLRHAPFTVSLDHVERDLVNTDRSTASAVTNAAGRICA